MKKIYSSLHNPAVQGRIIIALIIATITLTTILTWGK